MKIRQGLVLAAAIAAMGSGWGSGFGLYEPSVATHALGGAVVGTAVDASANFHNPATLSDITNVTVTVGFVTEHPEARIKVDDGKSIKMNPGVFWLPTFQLAVPLPWGFSFGLGMLPEFGLGSKYEDHWDLSWNSTETTIKSFTLNPNLAYAITKDWSIGAGMRFLYFDFEQYSNPYGVSGGYTHALMNNRLKGDNAMSDMGWQLGTRYRIFDNFSVGINYKSSITAHVRGKTRTSVKTAYTPYANKVAEAIDGSAHTKLKLPQSVTAGFNWDIIPTVHLGGAVAWTQWSSVGTLDFKLASVHKPIHLDWTDTMRYALGCGWDFAKDWTLMGSYVYETDCSGRQRSTMLPASERHILTAGLAWRCTEHLELDLSYGLVLMDGLDSVITDSYGEKYTYTAHRGRSHAVGFAITYRF